MIRTRLDQQTTLVLPSTEHNYASYHGVGCNSAFLGDRNYLLAYKEIDINW
jgi:hypothetical protein